MLIGEQENGCITELELRDVTFLENKFLHRGEINSDLCLFEMDDVDINTNQNQPMQSIEEKLHLSGSERNIQISKIGQIRFSEHIPVPQCCFNIENEVSCFKGKKIWWNHMMMN